MFTTVPALHQECAEIEEQLDALMRGEMPRSHWAGSHVRRSPKSTSCLCGAVALQRELAERYRACKRSADPNRHDVAELDADVDAEALRASLT